MNGLSVQKSLNYIETWTLPNKKTRFWQGDSICLHPPILSFFGSEVFNALDYSRRSAACDEQRILNCYKGIIRKYFIEKSIYPTKGQCGSHTELICHKYNETNELARRNLSLCRCVFIFCDILSFYSVGCRSPPFGLNLYIFFFFDWR